LSGQIHAPAALPARKEHLVPTGYEAKRGGQSRSGRGGEGKHSQLLPRFEPWNTDRPARKKVYNITYLFHHLPQWRRKVMLVNTKHTLWLPQGETVADIDSFTNETVGLLATTRQEGRTQERQETFELYRVLTC